MENIYSSLDIIDNSIITIIAYDYMSELSVLSLFNYISRKNDDIIRIDSNICKKNEKSIFHVTKLVEIYDIISGLQNKTIIIDCIPEFEVDNSGFKIHVNVSSEFKRMSEICRYNNCKMIVGNITHKYHKSVMRGGSVMYYVCDTVFIIDDNILSLNKCRFVDVSKFKNFDISNGIIGLLRSENLDKLLN